MMAKGKADKRSAAAADRAPKALAQPVTVATSDVARRAHDLYVARDCEHGHDMDDWLQAERELQARLISRLNQLADDGCPNVP